MTDRYPIVYVVDDDPAVRQSLQWLIESLGLHVRTHGSAGEFLDAYDHRRPGCLVLDVRMPGMSGLELQEQLNADGISIPVVFITAHADVPMAVRALRRGAADFIEKPFNDQQLLDCILAVIDHSTRAHRRIAETTMLKDRLNSLSERERQIIELVVAGEPNKAIASILAVSTKTVEAHRANLMRKMGARSLAELVRIFVSAFSTNDQKQSDWRKP